MSDRQANQGGQNDDRSVDELERDASVQRARVGRTLNELEGRLSPDRMVDNAVGLFREHGGEIADGLQRSVKSNPMPVILTGIGLAWMILGQRDDRSSHARNDYRDYGYRDGRYRYNEFSQPDYDTDYVSPDGDDDSGGLGDKAREAMDKARGAMSDARDSAGNAASSASDRAQQFGDRAQQFRETSGERISGMRQDSADAAERMQRQMASYRQQAGHRSDELGQDARRFMAEQPLVAGGIAIALGALIGAMFPATDAEKQAARRAIDSDAGQDAINKATETAKSVQKDAQSQIENVAQKASSRLEKSAADTAES